MRRLSLILLATLLFSCSEEDGYEKKTLEVHFVNGCVDTLTAETRSYSVKDYKLQVYNKYKGAYTTIANEVVYVKEIGK